MSDQNLAYIAKVIADDLFVNGMGDQADRLVLIVDGPPIRDLGGWSHQAMRARILAILKRQGFVVSG